MIKEKGKISSFAVVMFFFSLYPIMNAYTRVLGQQLRLILILLTILLLVIANNGKIVRIRKEKGIRHSMLIWVWILFIVAIIHQDTSIDIQRFLVWAILPPVILPVINSKDKFIKLISAIVIIGGITACLGIFEEVTHVNVFQLLNTNATDLSSVNMRMGILRIQSFSSHPITYCAYCMFILALDFYICTLPEKCDKWLYKVVYIVVLISAILTLSRSTLIAIIASQVLLLWLCGYKTLLKRIMQIILFAIVALLLVSFMIPNAWGYIQIPFLLVAAVFSDNYADILTSLGYGGDTTGVAERFILWQWVWEDTKNYMLLGHGPSAWLNRSFVNSGGYVQNKTSIEVQLLIQFFRYGIIAATAELFFYLNLLVSPYKHRNDKMQWEGKLSFPKMFLVLFLCYFVVLFAVTQNETIQILFATVMLFLAYVINNEKLREDDCSNER